ncbi:5-deoxy-glucuronate isomerase [Anaerotruncus rubiinfantis]|uniref:5-deoxy-glucuronate isomerase n=1 Tax=Anaerotruncus rubiinfantis TaxID=1720200 RepID=UPI0034A19FBE
MEMRSWVLVAGQEKTIRVPDQDELAVVLLRGDAAFRYNGEQKNVLRKSFFNHGIYCLHVCGGTQVTITAGKPSEIVLIYTENNRRFAPVFYTPENTRENIACDGLWEGTAVRKVRTAFEYADAPYSNLVLGETIMFPGRWSGYVPHCHEQPEVYYFRMENPDGFGASFVGEEVFKIKDGSFCAIAPNLVHPQVAAPGYPIYYLWLIRHLDGNPWIRENCSNEQAHTWLLK